MYVFEAHSARQTADHDGNRGPCVVDPLILPSGILAFDDPLLSARSAAYSLSFTRREGERKESSAISIADTAR